MTSHARRALFCMGAWDLGGQVPSSLLALLLEDHMVMWGSDLLLLQRFGHRAADPKLRIACFGLEGCLCGSFWTA